jgi:hypothetical protein
MKRTQILLDEDTYERLRREAFGKGESMAAFVRNLLKERFASKAKPTPKYRSIKDFTFIGAGRSGLKDLSERHDDYLAEDFD